MRRLSVPDFRGGRACHAGGAERQSHSQQRAQSRPRRHRQSSRVGGKDGLMHRYGNDIEELDINPLIVNAESAVAVDARAILSAKPELKATAQTNDAVPPIERFRPPLSRRPLPLLARRPPTVSLKTHLFVE